MGPRMNPGARMCCHSQIQREGWRRKGPLSSPVWSGWGVNKHYYMVGGWVEVGNKLTVGIHIVCVCVGVP